MSTLWSESKYRQGGLVNFIDCSYWANRADPYHVGTSFQYWYSHTRGWRKREVINYIHTQLIKNRVLHMNHVCFIFVLFAPFTILIYTTTLTGTKLRNNIAFDSISSPVIQSPVPKCSYVTGTFYRGSVLTSLCIRPRTLRFFGCFHR